MYNLYMIKVDSILQLTQNGIIFNVKLVPNSSFNKIADYTEEYVRIKISSPPIENKANKELIAFCSKLFDVNKSKISIISGEKSKLKKVLIQAFSIEELSQKLVFVLDSIHKEK